MKRKVFAAARDVIRLVVPQWRNGQLRVGKIRLCFSIYKSVASTDRQERAYSTDCTTMWADEVLEILWFDLHCNDLFVMGTLVVGQIRGVAIGGLM